MRQFSELSYGQQALLFVRVVQLAADGNSYKRIEDVAASHNVSSRGLWLKLCADEGFEACEPWFGFPDLPAHFTADGVRSEHPLVSKNLVKITFLPRDLEPIKIRH